MVTLLVGMNNKENSMIVKHIFRKWGARARESEIVGSVWEFLRKL